MDDTGALDPMHAAAILQPWMKDDYAGSIKEYNDTIIPIASIWFTRSLVNLQCSSFIILVTITPYSSNFLLNESWIQHNIIDHLVGFWIERWE
ncbi:predicted protein [Lichtheimia corymbifera JMRC:FSU:9682]|uniref:Uncharacterized protein n=1 Tax=Lichtheimia corymbifera JMRC:FSU:9682 TaxID=1263082 RepID=A0A068RFI6_9FUNG|nr:predicted protein [Lichtheimia corymbifera JMRC:FSU:9682]